jgi:GT2 family glycosyltransferase
VLLGSAESSAPARIDSAGDRYYLGGVAGKRGHRQPLTADYLHRCAVFGASGSTAFYRRAALRQVGGFAEEFGAYFEDVDLAFRLHRAGYRIVYQPDSRVFHRGGASHGRTSRQLLEQQSLNEERVFWRNLPAGDLLRALPRHALVLAAKAWRHAERGRLIPFLCGRLRLLTELPTLARHRAALRGLGPEAPLSAWEIEPRFWG